MLFEEYNVEIALQVREDETKENIAMELLKSGIPVETIQKSTHLSPKRIMELKQNLDLQLQNS